MDDGVLTSAQNPPDATTAAAVPTQTPTQATDAGTAARLGRPGARPAVPILRGAPASGVSSGGGLADPVTAAAAPTSAPAQPAPKIPSWDDVAATKDYQALEPDQKAKAKTNYFRTVILPATPGKDDSEKQTNADKAYQNFMRYHPDEPGLIQSFKRSLYGGLKQVAGDLSIARGAIQSGGAEVPETLPTDDKDIAAHYSNATLKQPTPELVAQIKADNKKTNADRIKQYSGQLEEADALFAKGDKQIEDAKKYAPQANEEQTFGGVVGSILGSLIPGYLDMPFAGQQAAVEAIKNGGTTKDAYKAALAATGTSAIMLGVPEAFGRVGGALTKNASKVIRWPTKAAAGVVGMTAVGDPAQRAIQNTVLPDDQKQSLLPDKQSLIQDAAFGIMGGAAAGKHASAPKLYPLLDPKDGTQVIDKATGKPVMAPLPEAGYSLTGAKPPDPSKAPLPVKGAIARISSPDSRTAAQKNAKAEPAPAPGYKLTGAKPQEPKLPVKGAIDRLSGKTPKAAPGVDGAPATPDLTRGDLSTDESAAEGETPAHKIQTTDQIKTFAQDRLDQLNQTVRGGHYADTGARTHEGNPIYDVAKPRHLTDTEATEHAFLTDNKDDHEAVAKAYGLEVKKPDVEGAKTPDIQDQNEPVKVVPVADVGFSLGKELPFKTESGDSGTVSYEYLKDGRLKRTIKYSDGTSEVHYRIENYKDKMRYWSAHADSDHSYVQQHPDVALDEAKDDAVDMGWKEPEAKAPETPKPVKPRIKLKPTVTPVTADEHVVASKATGDHRDDVPEADLSNGVHLAETNTEKAQELANEHRSNAAFDAATGHHLGAGATEESAQAQSGNADQRGSVPQTRDEAARVGGKSGRSEAKVGRQADGSDQGTGRVPAVADRQPPAGGLEGTWLASDGKTILGGNPPEGMPEPPTLQPHPRVNRENHVGLVGGIDRDDPNLVHIDSRMPHYEWMPDHDGPDGHSPGHWQNVDDEIVKHEDDENHRRNNINEKGYPTAHNEDGNAGTREHLAGDNTDSTVYSNVTRPYAERIRENTDPNKTPLRIDQRPYMPEHNEGKDDTHLLHPDAEPQHVDEAPPRPGDSDANVEREEQSGKGQELRGIRKGSDVREDQGQERKGRGKQAESGRSTDQGPKQEVTTDDLAARLTQKDKNVPVEVKAVPPPGNAARALAAAVKRMFGRDVVFVKVTGDDGGSNGFHIGGKKLFVNVDADKPHSMIIGHELLHSLRDTDPETYKKLVKAVSGLISDKTDNAFKQYLKDAYERDGLKPLQPDKLHEEMLADLVGDHFADPNFIKALQKELEPKLARRVLAHIDSALEKFRRTITGTPQEMGKQTRTMVDNVEAARTAVKSALADLAKSEKDGEAKPDILFKRKEKPTVHSIPLNFLSRIHVNVPTMVDGEIQNRRVNARTAIKDFDEEIGAFKSLLDCLKS